MKADSLCSVTYEVVNNYESSIHELAGELISPHKALSDHHSLSLGHISLIQHVRMPQGFSLIKVPPHNVLANMQVIYIYWSVSTLAVRLDHYVDTYNAHSPTRTGK